MEMHKEFGQNSQAMRVIKKLKAMTPGVLKELVMNTVYQLRAIQQLGGTYYCPVCRQTVKAFVPLDKVCGGKFVADININGVSHSVDNYETFNVKDFTCPVCGSQDKARLYALYLANWLSNNRQNRRLKLVHFAPEAGLHQMLKWSRDLDYRSSDLYRTDVDDNTDLTDMTSYGDESLDVLICSHILEHIYDDEKAVKEMYRVLRQDGWAIVMVPILLSIDHTYEDATKITESERLVHFGLEDHLRVYSKSSFIDLLTSSGFVVQQYGQEYFGKSCFKEHGISESSILYVVEKR
jgi:predicted SAM-dependent methyltransferase